MIGPLPATQRGTVLAGVNAKPCGWPAANVDSGCGRHPQTAAGTRLEEWARDQDPPIRGLHAFGGLPVCDPARVVGVGVRVTVTAVVAV
jgi:hypothetical protein